MYDRFGLLYIYGVLNMLNAVKGFVRDEDGATMIEYALLAALVAVAAIAGLKTLATSLQGTFSKVSGDLTAANGG
jgi:pilus assembly protein Flp/PilA